MVINACFQHSYTNPCKKNCFYSDILMPFYVLKMFTIPVKGYVYLNCAYISKYLLNKKYQPTECHTERSTLF